MEISIVVFFLFMVSPRDHMYALWAYSTASEGQR